MPALLRRVGPPPSVLTSAKRPDVDNAYFAIEIDSAVDLLEAREYQGLSRPDRLAKALGEQQGFLSSFFDPDLGAALDLRIIVGQPGTTPIRIALLGRVWGDDPTEVAARAEGFCGRLRASLPRHVSGTPVLAEATVQQLLQPFTPGATESAVITRHELIGPPSRPDAGVAYYFSAVPFNLSDNDWSAVYSALAASRCRWSYRWPCCRCRCPIHAAIS